MQVSGLHLEVDAGGEGYVRRHSHESKKNCSSMCMYKDAVTIPRGGGGGGGGYTSPAYHLSLSI